MKGKKSYWWDIYGPFDPDPNDAGYPCAGQVVKHYRLLKKWNTTQLAEALGTSRRWVENMENDNAVPEMISRRRAITRILSIPPILLGLAAPEKVEQLLEAAAHQESRKKIDTATLNQYQGFLRLYWEVDYSSTAQESLSDIVRWIRHLQALMGEASQAQQQQIAEILCRYHQLATWIARDQRDYTTAFTHANRALKLAQATDNSELIAAALFRRGRTRLEQGNISGAVADLDAAIPYAQHARPQLKGLVLLAAGHAHAHMANSGSDMSQALALIDQSGRIVRRGSLEEDESYVKLNTGRYHLDKAGAFLAMGRAEDALDELELADRGIGPDQTRRHAYITVLRAKAHLELHEPMIAIATAESTLQISKALKSAINIARITEIHEALKQTKLANSPQLARLGAMLVE